MQIKAHTYQEYLQLLEGKSCQFIEEKKALIIENFRETQRSLSKFGQFAYLVNYSNANYLFLEDTCKDLLGYTKKDLLQTGHRGYYSKMHPLDYRISMTRVFGDFYKFLKNLPLEKYSNYIFSYNCRFLNAKNEYKTLMQKHSYIPGNSLGNPSGAVGIVYDITHFKNDLNIVCAIEEVVIQNNKVQNKLVFKSIHPVCENSHLNITKRESEILKYLGEGLSTKQIACCLNLSDNTVNNHRKNMLQKTRCKNSVELLKYAIMHGLL